MVGFGTTTAEESVGSSEVSGLRGEPPSHIGRSLLQQSQASGGSRGDPGGPPGGEATEPKETIAPRGKRYLVVHEMLTTERVYVRNLETMRDVFVAPILADASCRRPTYGQLVTNSATAMLFFSNVDRMAALNGDLLRKLEERLMDTEWTRNDGVDGCVGDIFERYAPLFKMYSQFAESFEVVNQTVVDVSLRSSAVRQFLNACSENARVGGQTLASFLIQPIQRVPRYAMLLGEALKRTPVHHADHQPLSRALAYQGGRYVQQ